jgi:hypothetical protein
VVEVRDVWRLLERGARIGKACASSTAPWHLLPHLFVIHPHVHVALVHGDGMKPPRPPAGMQKPQRATFLLSAIWLALRLQSVAVQQRTAAVRAEERRTHGTDLQHS